MGTSLSVGNVVSFLYLSKEGEKRGEKPIPRMVLIEDTVQHNCTGPILLIKGLDELRNEYRSFTVSRMQHIVWERD